MDAERIIFGCGNFGGVGSLPELLGLGENEDQARELLNQSKEHGILQFDTANSYAGGKSEEILGQWISEQDSSIQKKIRVSTKVGNPFGTTMGERPLSTKEITFHLERSLKRLKVEQIQTYYLHEPDPSTPLDETLSALYRGLKAGDISTIGLSNAKLPYIKLFLNSCDEALRNKILFIQNEFHFLQQQDSEELIPFLEKEKISYVAFGPLAGGLLNGKYKAQYLTTPGSRLQVRPEPYARYMNTETFSKIDQFVKTALSDRITSAQAAVQFVLETKGISSVIIGPRRKEHFENLGFNR